MTIVAEAHEVSRIYGSFAALRKVNCSFAMGGIHVLQGENGAGKSTLLRVFAGLITPSAGKVSVLGGNVEHARARMAYMSHASMLYDELSAMENLRYFAQLHCSSDGCALCHASPEMALRAVGLDPSITRPVAHFSQGMRQRVSMARVLMADPELLLLDEPFSNMDAVGARELVVLLQDFLTWPMADGSAPARTIILTTHQHELVSGVAASVVQLRKGSVVSEPRVSEPQVTNTQLANAQEAALTAASV